MHGTLSRISAERGERLEKALLTTTEAAAALGIGRTKLYEILGQRDGIPVVRIGRSVRVPSAAVQEWVERQTERAREESLQHV